jgi:peptide/nickel transport system permease protein
VAAQIVREATRCLYHPVLPVAQRHVTEGKFGYSFAYRTDVGNLIKDRMPKTLFLATLAHLISTVLGIGLGLFVAPRKYGFWDNLSSVVAFIFTSVPRFSIALIILYVLVFTFDQPSIVNFFSPQYVRRPGRGRGW